MLRGLFLFKPMAYDKHLAGRITDCLSHISLLEEKKMFGGIGFMVNEKLSVGVMNDEISYTSFNQSIKRHRKFDTDLLNVVKVLSI